MNKKGRLGEWEKGGVRLLADKQKQRNGEKKNVKIGKLENVKMRDGKIRPKTVN